MSWERIDMGSNTAKQPLEVVRELYDLIFAADEEALKASLADDLHIVHQGTPNPGLPFYGQFHGVDGFFEWAKNLFETVELNLFEPAYFLADGNRVNVHVREGSIVKASEATHSIENFHSFVLDEDVRIKNLQIISDPLTVLNSLYGKPGEHFAPKYKKEVLDVERYPFDMTHNRERAENAVDCIARGKMDRLSDIFSGEALFIVNGDEAAVPYAGRFEGLEAIGGFVEAFSRDTADLNVQATVSEGNKADVHFALDGKPASTGKPFSHDTVASFQFDRQGKIAYFFYHMNTYEVRQAYLP
jgi:ketosteroid isomerase-like protein